MNASDQTAIAVREPGYDLSPRTFQEALQLADYMSKSEMVPKAYRGKPGDCLIAMQWGMEIGLKPLQALQSIAPINGKPNLYGDAGKALLLTHGCIIEEDDSEIVKTNSRARCRITRPGRPPVQRTFSVDDAKTAGLWNKEGPWRAYPWRQMSWRAFWFAARDAAADLLRGMSGYEEVLDIPPERHMGMVDEVPAQPRALPAYEAAAFTKNLPAWAKLVADGKKTAQDLLATLSTKATFTEQQKAEILRLKPAQAATLSPAPEPAPAPPPPPADDGHDDFRNDMGAAEGGAQ